MRTLQAILTSLAVHLLLVLILQNLPKDIELNSKPIEIEVLPQVSQHEKTQKTIVRDSLVPEKLKVQETQDQLKFLAERAQRVKEQTQAKLNGLTQNRNNRAQAQSEPKSEMAAPNKKQSSLDAFSNNYKPLPKIGRNTNAGGDGFSTISESVDVKVGTLTALNTDQYLFASFFNRVSELIYFRWLTHVQNAEAQVAARMANNFNDRWTTLIDIWVKPNGEYHSSHLLKSSGIREFDAAASQAFQQAGLFPNPPRELIEEDGYIHLKYNLTVFFDPQSMVRR